MVAKPCKFCDYEYKSQAGYRKHLKMLHKGEPEVYSCEECADGPWTTPNGLKKHTEKKHPEPESDTGLDALSEPETEPESKSEYKSVELTPEPTHKELVKECRFCDKMFASRTNRNNHILEEHQDELFNCEKCESQLLSKNRLARHMEEEHPENSDTESDEEEEEEKFDKEAWLWKLRICQRKVDEARRNRRQALKELRQQITKDHPDFMEFVDENLIQRDEQKRMWEFGVVAKKQHNKNRKK